MRYTVVEFFLTLAVALAAVVFGWSCLTGLTVTQVIFVYAGNL